METPTEIKGKIKAIADLAAKAFAEAGPDYDMSKVTCLQGKTTEEKVAELGVMQKQMNDLHDQDAKTSKLAEFRKSIDESLKFNSEVLRNEPKTESRKSIGEMFMKSESCKGENRRTRFDLDPVDTFGLKANFFTSSGWAPEIIRQPGFVGAPTRTPSVLDYLVTMPVSGAAVTFMLESTFTNNAAAKAEGDGAVESALALTETSKTVREVATFVPTSRVQLEDVAFAEAYLNNRLTLMVRQKLESQCLEGDGNAPNLEGTLNLGAIQTQALGADSRADAIYKAFDLIRTVGYAEPSVLFINPADWQPIRLSQTADGVYLFGNPADGDMNRIWGVPVVQTMAVTANTALTGDYANFAFLGIRRGVEVEMSSGYSDYFVKGKLAVLASLRAAMVHTRETAFCKLTGF